MQIADDGQGGAHLGKGHGLVGLQERAVANGGSLELVSDGSGTTVSLTRKADGRPVPVSVAVFTMLASVPRGANRVTAAS